MYEWTIPLHSVLFRTKAYRFLILNPLSYIPSSLTESHIPSPRCSSSSSSWHLCCWDPIRKPNLIHFLPICTCPKPSKSILTHSLFYRPNIQHPTSPCGVLIPHVGSSHWSLYVWCPEIILKVHSYPPLLYRCLNSLCRPNFRCRT